MKVWECSVGRADGPGGHSQGYSVCRRSDLLHIVPSMPPRCSAMQLAVKESRLTEGAACRAKQQHGSAVRHRRLSSVFTHLPCVWSAGAAWCA